MSVFHPRLSTTAEKVAYLVSHREAWWGKTYTVHTGHILAGMRRAGLISARTKEMDTSLALWITRAREVILEEHSARQWQTRCERVEGLLTRLLYAVDYAHESGRVPPELITVADEVRTIVGTHP